jgi:hypothetical protein
MDLRVALVENPFHKLEACLRFYSKKYGIRYGDKMCRHNMFGLVMRKTSDYMPYVSLCYFLA